MPDFLVMHLTGSDREQPRDWTPTVIARGVDDEAAAAQQGYVGEGRYKAVPWSAPEDSEFDFGPPGPPAPTPVTPDNEDESA